MIIITLLVSRFDALTESFEFEIIWIGWCVILMEELEGLISQGVFCDWD
jgi:hypothetical protein